MPKRRPRQLSDEYADAMLTGVARQARVAEADRNAAIVTMAYGGWSVPQLAALAEMTTVAVRLVLRQAEIDRCDYCGRPRALDPKYGEVTTWLHRPDAAELAGWHDFGNCVGTLQ